MNESNSIPYPLIECRKNGTRDKSGRYFFVSLDVNTEYNDHMEKRMKTVRQEIISKFDNLENFLCSIERCNDSQVSTVIQIRVILLLKFVIPIKMKDFKEIVQALLLKTYGHNSLTGNFENNNQEIFSNLWQKVIIDRPKSIQNKLLVITKNDKNLFTNFDENLLNFHYRIFKWAERTEEFDYTDPFVMKHKRYYKYLQKYLMDSKLENIKQTSELKLMEVAYGNWSMEVALWWNGMAAYGCNDTDETPNKRQLYIYGSTGVGKSSFIMKVIGRKSWPDIYYPEKGIYFMQSFNPRRHSVILFEQFNDRDYPINSLKRLITGEIYSYSVKNKNPLIFTFKGPIIFVSNSRITSDSLKECLLVINADRPYWHDRRFEVPKCE